MDIRSKIIASSVILWALGEVDILEIVSAFYLGERCLVSGCTWEYGLGGRQFLPNSESAAVGKFLVQRLGGSRVFVIAEFLRVLQEQED